MSSNYNHYQIILKNSELFPVIDAFNQTVRASGGAPNIFCLEDEATLNKWILEHDLMVAFDFDDPSSISDSIKDVQYSIRPKSDFFVLLNWESFVDTYKQQPSSTPAAFVSLFTPLQQLMDSVIEQVKTNSISSHLTWFKQFPNLNYYLDTRLEVLFPPLSSPCRILKACSLFILYLLFLSLWPLSLVVSWKREMLVFKFVFDGSFISRKPC